MCFKVRAVSAATEVLENVSSTSDYALYLTGIPRTGVTPEDVHQNLEVNCGKVVEVHFAHKFGKVLTQY